MSKPEPPSPSRKHPPTGPADPQLPRPAAPGAGPGEPSPSNGLEPALPLPAKPWTLLWEVRARLFRDDCPPPEAEALIARVAALAGAPRLRHRLAAIKLLSRAAAAGHTASHRVLFSLLRHPCPKTLRKAISAVGRLRYRAALPDVTARLVTIALTRDEFLGIVAATLAAIGPNTGEALRELKSRFPHDPRLAFIPTAAPSW